jgi:F-type H+-transporting ATPase subunit epsilon
MATIRIDVVSAEESIYSGEAEFVVLPGIMGELGIYPRHAPLITQIHAGTVRIKVPGKEEEEMVYVQGGFLEVQPDHINVLSDTAIRAADLDEAKVLEAKKAAEEAIRARSEKQEIATAEAELAAISAQLQAIQKLGPHSGPFSFQRRPAAYLKTTSRIISWPIWRRIFSRSTAAVSRAAWLPKLRCMMGSMRSSRPSSAAMFL